ncbi:hypothetical protein PISMIDRAFT_122009, partial [Pisolithus microcarpus 441]
AKKTPEQYQEELLTLKLEDNEVATTKEVNGTNAWTHVIWARETLRLAKVAGVEKDIGLVWVVHKKLPKVVRKLLKKKCNTFEDLAKEVREPDVEELQKEKEDIDEHRKEEEEREKRVMQQQKVSLADITMRMQ